MPRTQVLFYREGIEAPALDWLDEQSPDAREKCRRAIDRLGAAGHDLRRPEADYLRDGIYELRIRLGRVNYRLLYFFFARNVVLVAHGLTKEKGDSCGGHRPNSSAQGDVRAEPWRPLCRGGTMTAEHSEDEVAHRIEWIETNLETQQRWDENDYREFYDRDVRFLLSEVKRLQAENVRCRSLFRDIARQVDEARRDLPVTTSL
jgi:phage-related protein